MLEPKDQKIIATVVNTLRDVSVRDGNDNNLARMAGCIQALTDLVKGAANIENNTEQSK